MPKGIKRETKVGEFFPVSVDDAQGLVDHVVTVFGIVDEGNDVAHPGSFTKTIAERAGKVRVLDMHNHDSIMSVLGKPIRLWEVDRAGLPEFVRGKFPEATGALMATTKFLLDTEEGRGAFIRIKEGAVNEFSYTYDAVDIDYGKAMKDGKEITVRNLRGVRLWEISPVLWGMNQGTGVVDVKGAADEPQGGEEKPYEVRHEGDEWCVYKRDGGDSMGCHPTEDEANGQIAAIYANEKAVKPANEPTPETVPSDEKAGRVLAARNVARITAAVQALADALSEVGVTIKVESDATEPEPAGGGKAVGPAGTPSTEALLRRIEVGLVELAEVED